MLKAFAVILAFGTGVSSLAMAQSTTVERYYDAQGNPRGRLVQEGNRSVVLDQNGNRKSYFTRSDGRCEHRSMQGNLQGYSSGSNAPCP